MFQWKKVFGGIFIVSIIISALALFTLYQYTKQYQAEEIVLTEKNALEKEYIDKYRLDIKLEKQWHDYYANKEGAEFHGVFYNRTKSKLTNWKIILKVADDGYMDSLWNGNYLLENGTLTITPAKFNEVIESENSITLGFVMHSPEPFYITGYEIHFYRQASIFQYGLFWGIVIYLSILFVIYCTLEYTFRRIKWLQEQRDKLEEIIDESLTTFSLIIDAKDQYTKGHSERVAIYSKEIAKRMGLSSEQQKQVYYIALLHDIGKVGISDNILNKTSKLTDVEEDALKQHVIIGGNILKDFTSIPCIDEGAKYHHERYDGTGYAEGIKGEEIPLFARIIGVADSFDAMSSCRCYRTEMNLEYVIRELRNGAGTQFDPQIVEYMLAMIYDGKAPVYK